MILDIPCVRSSAAKRIIDTTDFGLERLDQFDLQAYAVDGLIEDMEHLKPRPPLDVRDGNKTC